jgi:hypothetical protein
MVALPDPGVGRNPPRYLPRGMSLGACMALMACAIIVALAVYFVLSVN